MVEDVVVGESLVSWDSVAYGFHLLAVVLVENAPAEMDAVAVAFCSMIVYADAGEEEPRVWDSRLHCDVADEQELV